MKSLKIGIKFENDAIKSDATDGVVFFAGQQVKGDVVLDCPGRPFALNKICLVVHGRTKVSFDIFHTHHNAHVVHLHEQVPVWVGGKEGTIKLFPAGEYRFPFQFILGANCPPNFKGTQGNIRYHFTVRVEEKTKLGWLPNWLCWSRRRILIQPFGISQRPSPLEFTTTISEQIEHPLANGELVKAKITLGRDKFEQSERIPLKIAFDCAQQLIKLVHSLHYRIVEYVDYESDKQHHCREKKCLLRDQIDLTTMAHFVDDKNELDLLTKPVPTNGPSILNCALIHKFHVLKVRLVISTDDAKKMLTKECWFQIKIY